MDKLNDALQAWSTAEAEADALAPGTQPNGFDADDLAEFRQALRQGPSSPSQSVRKDSDGAFDAVVTSLRGQTGELFKTMQKFGATADPIQSLKMQSQLSKLYVEHALAVKVIGKSAQAIDTLSKLQ